ncbi:homoserine kinase [Caldisphaera lagunensis DSM 15908]|uniref:Homoserine kinase n=1 Tax=Caldisphaera lagunensis (strain DSM 15908 / JCM 11604 / ANMR 0165 / IC-154) TaxID=1056495 RepID=L0A9Z8_CALLD|nr:homoserine kinase [Caldisphaera lagunensis]AFZ70723.1 homoserine kinase [Caldisphaera lagunensis DSM 15908]
MEEVWAKAYSSSANLGPGFDVLSLAHDAYYDVVSISAKNGAGDIKVEKIDGPFSSNVSENNSASYAIRYMMNDLKLNNYDISIKIWKGIPVSSGLGGSGASAAAAVFALSNVLDLGLKREELIKYAGQGEIVSAGVPHYDNVSASLLGKLVVVGNIDDNILAYSFDINASFIIFRPINYYLENKTQYMRSLLPKFVEFKHHIHDTANLGILISSLLKGDLKAAGKAMNDTIVTNARAKAVPCFMEIKEALHNEGAYGVAISGAGPSIIVLYEKNAENLINTGLNIYKKCNINAEAKIVRPAQGTKILYGDNWGFSESA